MTSMSPLSPTPPAPALPSDLLRTICPGAMDGFKTSRQAIAAAGPLDAKTMELIMLGAFATMGYETAVKVHAGRLLDMGVPKAAVQQAVLATFGATTTVVECSRALAWIEQIPVPTGSATPAASS